MVGDATGKRPGRQRELRCWTLLTFVALSLLVIGAGWLAYEWVARARMLQTMLGEGDYSLTYDRATISRA